MPLSIALDARPLLNPHSGIGTYLHELLTRLLNASSHRWFLYLHQPLASSSTYPNVTVRSAHATNAVQGAWIAQHHFARWAKQDGVDLFWSPRHQLPLRLPPALPTAVTLHDLVFKRHPETMTVGGHLLERALTPHSLRRASKIITTSNAMLKELAQHFPAPATRAQVIPLSSSLDGVVPDSHDSLPGHLKNSPFALFCGSFEPRKNLDRLITAFAAAKANRAIPQRLVLVTGGGWRDTRVRELINQYHDWIDVEENISEPRKALLYQRADFVLLPSLYEGFGIPLVEALKLGKASITSNNSAMPEVAGPAALYVDPQSTDDITRALATLGLDVQQRRQLEKQASAQAQRFSWALCARDTLAVFESLG